MLLSLVIVIWLSPVTQPLYNFSHIAQLKWEKKEEKSTSVNFCPRYSVPEPSINAFTATDNQRQKTDQPGPHIPSVSLKQSNCFQFSDQMGWTLKQLHPQLTGLFGASGFEHVPSDPPPLAVAWPPASHAAPDDYVECLLPSDAQLEINIDKNPRISLKNFMVLRWNKGEGYSKLER